jgi:putative ABC transport system permease protein
LTDATRFRAVDFQVVLPAYFEVMGTDLVAGRTFNEGDNTTGSSAVVVDELLARKAFANRSAVGQRILVRIRTPQPEWVEIVGVVAHQRAASLAEPGREQIFFTDGFLGHGAVSRWAIRVDGDGPPYEAAVRAAVAERGGRLAMGDVVAMPSLVDRSTASTRFALVLLGALAVGAAMLSAVGTYGVLSNVVRERTSEIGIRMAVGAAPASILRLVTMQALALAAVGVALGGTTTLSMTHVMTSMLVGVEATDTRTLVAVALVVLLIAAVSAWLPAFRAARLDPTVALREP